jgi:transcriptional regulator with XRE-family HTH domain
MSTGDPAYGRALRRRREDLGLTLARLGELAGVSAPYLSQIETGKRTPSDDVLVQIEQAFADLEASPSLAGSPPSPGRADDDVQVFVRASPAEVEAQAGGEPSPPDQSRWHTPAPGTPPPAAALSRSSAGGDRGRSSRRTPSAPGSGDRSGGGRSSYLDHLLQTRSPEVTSLLLAIEQAAEVAREASGRPLPASAMADLVRAATHAAARDASPEEVVATVRTAATLLRGGADPDSLVGVLATTPGRPVSLRNRDVAVDEEGRAWLDPRAIARPWGHDLAKPRAVLHADGHIWVDLTRVPPGKLTARTPDRHTLRVIRAVALPREPTPFGEYEQTVLEIELPGGTVTVGPADPGVADGRFPDDVREVVVLTAENPEGQVLTAEENDRRMRWLAAVIAERGWRCVPARTRVPDGRVPHALDERAVATLDARMDDVVDVAVEFGQRSVFLWTPQSRAVVTATRRRYEHGWRVE